MLYSLHTQANTIALVIYLGYSHSHVLMQMYYGCRVGNEFIGKLGYVNKTVLMNTYIDKCAKVGDVGNDTREFHSFVQVVNTMYRSIKLELFQLFTWVTPWLF